MMCNDSVSIRSFHFGSGKGLIAALIMNTCSVFSFVAELKLSRINDVTDHENPPNSPLLGKVILQLQRPFFVLNSV